MPWLGSARLLYGQLYSTYSTVDVEEAILAAWGVQLSQTLD